MKLEELQHELMAYLTDGNIAIVESVVEQGGINSIARLNIYANAYRVRLREVIDTDHPVLGSYLGDELFNKMVKGYIDLFPSRFKSLRYFASRLPDYLSDETPFREYPVLSDLAKFERVLLHAFDAAEHSRMVFTDLQKIPQDAWPEMTFRFHPSVQLFNTDWNSVEIWQAIKQEAVPPAAEIHKGMCWLLWRNTERLTEFISIESTEYAIITSALEGSNFSNMCALLQNYLPSESVSSQAVTYLTQWVRRGLLHRVVC